MVKEIVQEMIKEHLGWLVIWAYFTEKGFECFKAEKFI